MPHAKVKLKGRALSWSELIQLMTQRMGKEQTILWEKMKQDEGARPT